MALRVGPGGPESERGVRVLWTATARLSGRAVADMGRRLRSSSGTGAFNLWLLVFLGVVASASAFEGVGGRESLESPVQ